MLNEIYIAKKIFIFKEVLLNIGVDECQMII